MGLKQKSLNQKPKWA